MPVENMKEFRYGGSVYGTLGHPVDVRVCKIDSVGVVIVNGGRRRHPEDAVGEYEGIEIEQSKKSASAGCR